MLLLKPASASGPHAGGSHLPPEHANIFSKGAMLSPKGSSSQRGGGKTNKNSTLPDKIVFLSWSCNSLGRI